MVSHKTIHSMAMVGLEKNIGKTIDTTGSHVKKPLREREREIYSKS